MPEYFDISAEDYPENEFPAKNLDQEEAIKQSLKEFLTSAPSDFIFGEQNGGIIKSLLFKQLNDDNVLNAKYRIKNAIINGFFPAIVPSNIQVDRDLIKRAWVITIGYESPITGTPQETKILVKDFSDRDKEYKLIDIPYTGSNLTNFARLQKFKFPQDRLQFKEGKYIFNKYVLINFNKYSSNFQEVSDILA